MKLHKNNDATNEGTFASRLKAWRARHELTQMQAALRLGCSVSCLRYWEQELAHPPKALAVYIERAIAR